MFKVNTQTLETSRESVPANLKGLATETLQNLQTSLDPVPSALVGIEFWPEFEQVTNFNPKTHKLGAEILTVDPTAKTVTVSYEVDPLSAAEFEVAKTTKLAELAEIRWNAEESGTTFGGNPLATDRTTQAKLTAGYAKAVNDPDFVIASWKFAAGVFGSLDATTIIAAANAVEAHIQACFTNEAELSANVLAAADFAALEAVDFEAGWP
jgi:hypothetical protein